MYVGIDIGGTNLKAGLVDEEGHLLSVVREPQGKFESQEVFVRRLADLALSAIREGGVAPSAVKGVGMGIPGAVEGGKILYVCNLPVGQMDLGKAFA